MAIKIPQMILDALFSALMKIDFMPFVKTKLGAIVLVASEAITKISLPAGSPAIPLAEIQTVLQWIGTVLILYGLAMWKARSMADNRGIAAPYILDMKRIQKEVLGG